MLIGASSFCMPILTVLFRIQLMGSREVTNWGGRGAADNLLTEPLCLVAGRGSLAGWAEFGGTSRG